MTREDIQDLLVGAVVIVLGYALYKNYKMGTPGQGTPAKDQGIAVGEQNPGANLSPFDLLTMGAVTDLKLPQFNLNVRQFGPGFNG